MKLVHGVLSSIVMEERTPNADSQVGVKRKQAFIQVEGINVGELGGREQRIPDTERHTGQTGGRHNGNKSGIMRHRKVKLNRKSTRPRLQK